MRILLATDAWAPQINGVVRAHDQLVRELRSMNAEVSFVCPDQFATVPFPIYPEIRLALPNASRVAAYIERLAPQFIHIATEGPIGWMVRAYCLKHRHPFTSSYHTRFPMFAALRAPVPESWFYRVQKRFHDKTGALMVATKSMSEELERWGFRRIVQVNFGVDCQLFRPRRARLFGRTKPIFLFVGRLSIEKNIEAFLSLDLPGQKVVVGDGPLLRQLKARFPQTIFTGTVVGERLAKIYASSDVFVFPSRSETFGLVLLEAMASGLPVAAFPVTGPKDLVLDGVVGCLDDDLGRAALSALDISRTQTRAHAECFSWKDAAREFVKGVLSANESAEAASRKPIIDVALNADNESAIRRIRGP